MYEGNYQHIIIIILPGEKLGGARGDAAICGFFINYILFFGFLRSFSGRDLKLSFFPENVCKLFIQIIQGDYKSYCSNV